MRVIVIYSGGLDSTVALWWHKAQGHKVKALGFDYGQRHKKELQTARAICEENSIPFDVVDLSALTKFIGGSSQTSMDIQVPDGHYADESMKLTVVPNRNMIMLSIAAGHAISLKFDAISYAAHGGDHAIYPDCRMEYINALGSVMALADWHPIKLIAPFAGMTKTEIVKLGSELNSPLEKTWSCYKGMEAHCGKCGTCVERIEAFVAAGRVDLTEYK
jgi:7-cyano-7-deazaguanine synthase